MFLIDTNVISEARKGRRADTGVQGFWAAAAQGNTVVFDQPHVEFAAEGQNRSNNKGIA